jgi:hypothetical protein
MLEGEGAGEREVWVGRRSMRAIGLMRGREGTYRLGLGDYNNIRLVPTPLAPTFFSRCMSLVGGPCALDGQIGKRG